MDIFDGLHPQCADSIDVEKSDTSEDSDMEVIEQLVEPAEAEQQSAKLPSLSIPASN